MSLFRILVIDDEPDIRKVVQLSLARDPGLTVRVCASGSEGLVAATEWDPDLVLLDVMMPGMDGPATLAALRANPLTVGVPVVFLTARASSQDLEHMTALGAVGAIAKPFEPRALRESVRAYLSAPVAPPTVPAEDVWPLDVVSGEEREEFRSRLRADAVRLQALQARLLQADADTSSVRDELRVVIHKLAGAAGLYGFGDVSRAASALEKSLAASTSGGPATGDIVNNVKAFVDDLECA
jgi:CheY-like chemotaxis protein